MAVGRGVSSARTDRTDEPRRSVAGLHTENRPTTAALPEPAAGMVTGFRFVEPSDRNARRRLSLLAEACVPAEGGCPYFARRLRRAVYPRY